jgi:hypothetical protein
MNGFASERYSLTCQVQMLEFGSYINIWIAWGFGGDDSDIWTSS